LGTGNDFARSLNLATNVEENIDILEAGKTTTVDLVQTKSRFTRYFVNVSAGGFSGIVGEKLTPEIKRSWGPLAYLRGAAAALPELKAYRTHIVCGDEHLTLDLYNVVIANGRFVAGGLPIAPQANLRDGLLDLILIPKLAPASIALLAAKVILGQHLDMIITRRARKVSVKSRPGMWFNVDGELVGKQPIVFQVIPRALTFVSAKK
jgi:diacylglycerol kinase (ATP)